MPVTVYKSTDGSAPVLSGTAGALITLLNAVLVNGYGAKAAAGWTRAFSGTNKAAYRNHASGTNFYLRVDDESPNATSGAREAVARGYETMSAVDTGVGPFPTIAQLALAAGVVLRKSYTADATARPWIIIADNKTLYMFIKSGDMSGWNAFAFGDIFSLKTGDAYRAIIAGRNGIASELDDVENLHRVTYTAALTAGHWMPRSWSGQYQSAITVGKHGDAAKSASAATLFGIVGYPNSADNALMLAPVWVHEDGGSTLTIRGRMRGFWHFLHPISAPVNDGDTFSGSGALSGKTFIVIKPSSDGLGVFVIETSDTWETN